MLLVSIRRESATLDAGWTDESWVAASVLITSFGAVARMLRMVSVMFFNWPTSTVCVVASNGKA